MSHEAGKFNCSQYRFLNCHTQIPENAHDNNKVCFHNSQNPEHIAKVTIRAWLHQGSLQLAGWTAIFARQAMDIVTRVAVQFDVQLHTLQL